MMPFTLKYIYEVVKNLPNLCSEVPVTGHCTSSSLQIKIFLKNVSMNFCKKYYQWIPVFDCHVALDGVEHLRGVGVSLSEQSPGVLAVAVGGDFVARHHLSCKTRATKIQILIRTAHRAVEIIT